MGCTQSKEKTKKLNKSQTVSSKKIIAVDEGSIHHHHHHNHANDGDGSGSSVTTNSSSREGDSLESTVNSKTNPSFGPAASRRRTDNLGVLASPSQQKIISPSTTPVRRGQHSGGAGFGTGEDDAVDFCGTSPVNMNQTAARPSDSASLLSESVRWRSCASRFGGGANTTAMSSALINSQYFYSFATTENSESGTPMPQCDNKLPGVRIEYFSSPSQQEQLYDPESVTEISNISALTQAQRAAIHSPMSPHQSPSRRQRELNVEKNQEHVTYSVAPLHLRTETANLEPSSISDDDGMKTVSPALTVASTAGLSVLSPQTNSTPATLSDHHPNQFATAIHIRTQSVATNASVKSGGAAPTPRYYCSDESDTPTTTIYHEKLSALLSGPEMVSQASNNQGVLSPHQHLPHNESVQGKVESDDGSDHDGSPTIDRIGTVEGTILTAAKKVDAPVCDDETFETTIGGGKKKRIEEQNATYINKLTVVAEGTDPASRYVKAKLAMGVERPKEGKGFDMSAFRVGCDSIFVNKKPDFHLYNPATDPMLLAAKGRRASNASNDGSQPKHEDDYPRSTTTAETSFADLLNPTCTWDLLHSIPDAIAKVNSGDLLYRFCAKKYKDLPLEDRVEIASHINMSGFKDELAENDQPILDFIHNKNSVGPSSDGISAAAALDAKVAKQAKKDGTTAPFSEPSHIHNYLTEKQTPATEVEEIDLDNVLVCVLRLVGIMPRVTSRDANVDCVMNTDFQRLLAAPDEVFEPIDRFRTFRKVKHIIPFVFSFRFQMTGSELVDDETMAEHAHHHDAKPTRIVVTERTKKHRGSDSTIKSKAFFTFYDIPPRGISSITGKALAPELAQRQAQELMEVSKRLGGQSPEDIPSENGKGKKKKHNKHSHSVGHHPHHQDSSTGIPLIPEKPGGILCVHTAIIIRTSMPKVLAGMVESVGNKMGKQATGQIFKVRQFLLERKLSGWPEMAGGGDNPNVKFMWDDQ